MGKSADAPEIKETPEEKELARIAMERWDDYENHFVPVENQYMQMMSHVGPSEARQVEGRVASNVHQGFEPVIGQVDTALHRAGVNPASGRARDAEGDLYTQEGRALGLGATAGGNQVENLHYRGLESVVNMGLGIKDNAQLGLGSAAQLAAQNAANKAQVDQYTDAARSSALGTAAGAFAAYGLPYMNRK